MFRLLLSFPFHVTDFLRGLGICFKSFVKNCCNEQVNETQLRFIREAFFPVLLSLYLVVFVLLLSILPVTLTLIIFAPGPLFQLLLVIPVWAFTIAQIRHPIFSCGLFIKGLQSLDVELAEDFNNQLFLTKSKSSWWKAFIDSGREITHFAFLSFVCLLLAIIPIIGSILAVIGQLIVTANRLSFNFTRVYMERIKGMRFKEKRKFMDHHAGLLLGFCLPYTIIMSIPLLGPYLLGYGQASAAHLIYEMIKTKDVKNL